MKYGFYSVLLFLIAIFSFQCGEAAYEGTKIKGTISGAENLQVFIDQITLTNSMKVRGKADAGSGGKFEVLLEDLEPGIYRIRIGAKAAIFALSGEEKRIEINGDLSTLEANDYTLTGSKEANTFKSFIGNRTKGKLPSQEVKNFVDTTNSVMSAMFLTLTQLNPKEDMDYVTTVKNKLSTNYPNSIYVTEYDKVIGQIKQQLARERIKVGEEAPEIELTSPDGKMYKLSELRGKVVLIDFWASWCKPCRINNPKLVALYKKYKSKGFTVYSVSLDRQGQEKRWVQAIQEDNLTWPYHVSDLQFWQCAPAQEYGVRSIPHTFLLDKEGKFAAINPSSRQLEAEIEKLL